MSAIQNIHSQPCSSDTNDDTMLPSLFDELSVTEFNFSNPSSVDECLDEIFSAVGLGDDFSILSLSHDTSSHQFRSDMSIPSLADNNDSYNFEDNDLHPTSEAEWYTRALDFFFDHTHTDLQDVQNIEMPPSTATVSEDPIPCEIAIYPNTISIPAPQMEINTNSNCFEQIQPQGIDTPKATVISEDEGTSCSFSTDEQVSCSLTSEINTHAITYKPSKELVLSQEEKAKRKKKRQDALNKMIDPYGPTCSLDPCKDIVCEAGAFSNNNPPNRKLLELVKHCMPEYHDGTRASKTALFDRIYESLIDSGARFLVRLGPEQPWMEAKRKAGRDKVSRMFRDLIRNSSRKQASAAKRQ